MVQVPDSGMRMKASLLKTEFQRGGSLQSLLLRYMQALYALTSQNAACNRLHYLEGRLARWLLLVCDRVESNELPLTQEFMSQMLGVRRAGVTEAANTLQQAGLIRYTRGKITILNREELEAASCECYEIINGEYVRLLHTEYVEQRILVFCLTTVPSFAAIAHLGVCRLLFHFGNCVPSTQPTLTLMSIEQ